MLNKEIKGLLWRRAGGGMTLSPSFWKVSETKISDKVSHVTPLSELNEMVQYPSSCLLSALTYSNEHILRAQRCTGHFPLQPVCLLPFCQNGPCSINRRHQNFDCILDLTSFPI